MNDTDKGLPERLREVEGCQWRHEVVVRGASAATSSGFGCCASGGRCVPGSLPDCPTAALSPFASKENRND